MNKNLSTIWLNEEIMSLTNKYNSNTTTGWYFWFPQDKSKIMKAYVRTLLICQWVRDFFAESGSSFWEPEEHLLAQFLCHSASDPVILNFICIANTFNITFLNLDQQARTKMDVFVWFLN